jgi:hypothetical protein
MGYRIGRFTIPPANPTFITPMDSPCYLSHPAPSEVSTGLRPLVSSYVNPLLHHT